MCSNTSSNWMVNKFRHVRIAPLGPNFNLERTLPGQKEEDKQTES